MRPNGLRDEAACKELTPADIDRDTVEGAAVTYLEGYLWDPPKAKEAFRIAAGIAQQGRVQNPATAPTIVVMNTLPIYRDLARRRAVSGENFTSETDGSASAMNWHRPSQVTPACCWSHFASSEAS